MILDSLPAVDIASQLRRGHIVSREVFRLYHLKMWCNCMLVRTISSFVIILIWYDRAVYNIMEIVYVARIIRLTAICLFITIFLRIKKPGQTIVERKKNCVYNKHAYLFDMMHYVLKIA